MPAICHLGKFDEIINKNNLYITLRDHQVTLQPVFKDRLTSQGPEEKANDSPCFAKSLSGCFYQSGLHLKARKHFFFLPLKMERQNTLAKCWWPFSQAKQYREQLGIGRTQSCHHGFLHMMLSPLICTLDCVLFFHLTSYFREDLGT